MLSLPQLSKSLTTRNPLRPNSLANTEKKTTNGSVHIQPPFSDEINIFNKKSYGRADPSVTGKKILEDPERQMQEVLSGRRVGSNKRVSSSFFAHQQTLPTLVFGPTGEDTSILCSLSVRRLPAAECQIACSTHTAQFRSQSQVSDEDNEAVTTRFTYLPGREEAVSTSVLENKFTPMSPEQEVADSVLICERSVASPWDASHPINGDFDSEVLL